ncbi:UDP-2,4-diacetamido-2,4,6-trideoxy-beta-L-altropyranose hydrolase [Mucilaginibacter phyllosphaerae]|uniref:UDP-2,4-diacetamido-2,4, 6-trideoxy-beta-L-altropyranose hydrolase n=1 Tax=Mucilaginibacter phyllosphaerae TaxID=1812349 RepID=A0A4Y8AHG0_9SPHI|nr:UDP-2,4-diacetamido-2,4,6-trideoxy-beta-L-altropyranose hydrolase [Mucilaginibacter phyllosphaerae]MBB3968640.1 UDP-2,4-diacetamido-2,4,6-trideoxy-beta-L-altropyranose hydrolase [Mucilaginibacter phyllosphaerae]TEW67722.1 UDP-2,4-diacetamido-2,4,6-trideoxy-beta-L-altropyranose hydrolase [Mucilaginibacter phyllosphaerae]
MKRKVVFRADGSHKIGYGHFIRCLGIAGLIKDDFDCAYATISPTPYQVAEINAVCKLIQVPDNNDFLSCLVGDEIVVIDDYNSTAEFQLAVKAKGCKVVYIDDHNDKQYVCDVLINNIPGFAADSFKTADYTRLYLGTDYALLRSEFLNKELRTIKPNINEAFLAFGGSDIFNLSPRFIKWLNEVDATLKINLLIGDAYKHFDDLQEFSNLNIYKNISAAQVANLIAQSNVCIVPASSLLNEAAAVSSKLIIGYFADNQVMPYNYFVDNKLALGLNDYRDATFEQFASTYKAALTADYLVDNQREAYHYQQGDNLKNIFYNV